MHYQVTLDAPKMYAVMELQGDPQLFADAKALSRLKFPSVPNSYEPSASQSEQTGYTVYWIGPQRWLVRAALDKQAEIMGLTDESTLPDAASAILISDSLSFLKITGNDADAVLSIASPMDVHTSVFPDNGASYTDVFGLKALVIRCSDGFEVVVERSYTDMLLDYLQRAIGTST